MISAALGPGTDDGQIHKCSTAYLEQCLDIFSVHMGPVYRVQWSPFCPGIFLSASADWTVNVWADGKVGQPCQLSFRKGL